MSSRRSLLLGLVLLVAAGPAAAQGEQDHALSTLVFHHEQRVLQDQNFDTGWRPPNGLIQVRFQFQLGGGLEATLPGDGVLAWPERYDLTYLGEELGGRFAMNVGVEMSARLRFDLPLPGGGSISWEGEIPFVPNFDFRFGDEAQFTPFLLEGSPERPAHVEDVVDEAELFTVDLTDLIVAIPGIGGGVVLKAGGELQADLAGDRIDTMTRAGDALRHDAEGEVVAWPPQQTWIEQGTATYEATVSSQGTLLLVPAVYIEFLTSTWELAEFEIPIDLPQRDEAWSFEPQPLVFELAHINVSSAAHDFGSVDVGGSASWTLTVHNSGGTTLHGTVAVDGDFGVGPAAFALDTDEAQNLLVRFLPASAGLHQAELVLTSNDPLWSPYTVSLRGTGVGEDEPEAAPDAEVEWDADAEAASEAEAGGESTELAPDADAEWAAEAEAGCEAEAGGEGSEPEIAFEAEAEGEGSEPELADGPGADPGKGSGAGCDCEAVAPGPGAGTWPPVRLPGSGPVLLFSAALLARRRRSGY